jgi:predicted extracellular nuclease
MRLTTPKSRYCRASLIPAMLVVGLGLFSLPSRGAEDATEVTAMASETVSDTHSNTENDTPTASEATEAAAAASPAPATSIAAQNTEAITAAMGSEITVEGTVDRIGESKTRQILFINFADVERNGISLIIKQGTFAGDVVKFDPEYGSRLVGKKIRVTGEVTEYRGEPQIQVFAPSQLEVIEEAEPVSEAEKGEKS